MHLAVADSYDCKRQTEALATYTHTEAMSCGWASDSEKG